MSFIRAILLPDGDLVTLPMADLKDALVKLKPFFSDPEATNPGGKPCEVSRGKPCKVSRRDAGRENNLSMAEIKLCGSHTVNLLPYNMWAHTRERCPVKWIIIWCLVRCHRLVPGARPYIA